MPFSSLFKKIPQNLSIFFNFSSISSILSEEKPETNGTAENGETTNGHSEVPAEDPQAGPSTSNENESSNDAQETENAEDEAEDGGNLEVAWEVLQNASGIFERQEKSGLKNLMEVYIEMAGISLENGNFEASMKDFNRALDVFEDLEDADQNTRIAAEVRYKIGLCQTMEKQYDESVKSFQAAADLIADVITKEKAREELDEEAAKDLEESVKDLEEMHQEILNKITEIGETKAEEIELVKREMMKMYGPGVAESSEGAGSSSSAGGSAMKSPEEGNKPKPTDISHLIKRKKPDGESAVEESPAKKKAVETSPGEKVAVDVVAEKPVEEVETVQVVDN